MVSAVMQISGTTWKRDYKLLSIHATSFLFTNVVVLILFQSEQRSLFPMDIFAKHKFLDCDLKNAFQGGI